MKSVVGMISAGQQGSAALEGTLRAVGEAMAAMQALWERIAPQSHWCGCVALLCRLLLTCGCIGTCALQHAKLRQESEGSKTWHVLSEGSIAAAQGEQRAGEARRHLGPAPEPAQ